MQEFENIPNHKEQPIQKPGGKSICGEFMEWEGYLCQKKNECGYIRKRCHQSLRRYGSLEALKKALVMSLTYIRKKQSLENLSRGVM